MINKVCFDAQDQKLFDKLPKYAQRAATSVYMNKTRDGYHCSITYINKDGEEESFDEYGIGDFLWMVRRAKDSFGEATEATKTETETTETTTEEREEEPTMMTLEKISEIARTDRETYREMMTSYRENIAKLEEIKSNTDRPDETVRLFVEAVGYDEAVDTIANLVNRFAWDGRIYRANADWAKDHASLAEEVMVDKGLYTSMHMAHLDQIADEMRMYEPTEEAETTEEESLTEVDVMEALKSLEDAEIVEAWNVLCDNINDHDHMVNSMDDFDWIMSDTDPLALTMRAFYGSFNPNDDWFAFNGYGNLVSFGYAERLADYICVEDIATDYIENPSTYADTALGYALGR